MITKLLSLFLLFVLTQASLAVDARLLRDFPHHQSSKFFEFYGKQNPDKLRELARFADGFVRVVHRQFFTADFEFPITVLVLEDRERFQAFLRKEAGMPDPPNFGIYFPEFRLFATYQDSGLGTFAHEILHPLVEANLPLHPVWATEGIPTFFEKFYGYWKDDELILDFGYQNPWRIHAIGPELPNLDLQQILNYKDTQGRFRESEQRLVSMFLWDQGKFKPMLKLIQKGQPPPGYQTWFEAAMEKPIADIVPLWQAWLKQVAQRSQGILRLPPSLVFPDEASYRAFAAEQRLSDKK